MQLRAKEPRTENVAVSFKNNILFKIQHLEQLEDHHFEHEPDTFQQKSVSVGIPTTPLNVPAFENMFHNGALDFSSKTFTVFTG